MSKVLNVLNTIDRFMLGGLAPITVPANLIAGVIKGTKEAKKIVDEANSEVTIGYKDYEIKDA